MGYQVAKEFLQLAQKKTILSLIVTVTLGKSYYNPTTCHKLGQGNKPNINISSTFITTWLTINYTPTVD